jgi:NADPH:quinone reductase
MRPAVSSTACLVEEKAGDENHRTQKQARRRSRRDVKRGLRMKAIGLMQFGGPEVLGVVEVPKPVPGPGEVRIRVHAVCVNPTDVSFRSGRRAAELTERRPPYIPGIDVAGVVDMLGADTEGRLAVGDRVIGFGTPAGPRGGTYAQQIVVDSASVVHAPSGASFPEASTLLLNAVTARLAVDALALSSGATVSITGAAGAVGGYATQLAKAHGLTVQAVARRSDIDLVRELGADEIIDPGADAAIEIRRVLPLGVPGLIDGAALDARALPAVMDGGGLVALKFWGGPGERGITVHHVAATVARTDTALLELLRDQAEQGALTLRVADVLPAREAAEAHRRLAAGGVRGRIILDFSEPL